MPVRRRTHGEPHRAVLEIGLAVGLLAAGSAGAETVTLGARRDNTLIEHPQGALSNGAGPHLFAGRTSTAAGSIRRGLLAFDPGPAIPPGSTILSAVLTLHLSQTNAGAVQISLHRALSEWGEGASAAAGGGGAPAASGDATWVHTFYDTRFWEKAGGDFDSVAVTEVVVDSPGFYAWSSPAPSEGPAADVQKWLDEPSANHGWVILGDESSPTTVKRFDTRENPDPAFRPSLSVEFIPPCKGRFAGPGYWRRQCLSLYPVPGNSDFPLSPAEPDFEAEVLPCAERMLADLTTGGGACEAMTAKVPLSCENRAVGRLTTLVFNLCSGRLQKGCPVERQAHGCPRGTLEDLLRALSDFLRLGDCRQASRCAAFGD